MICVAQTRKYSWCTSTYPGDPPNPVPEVSADHPKVRQAVEEAESRARTVHLEITSEMYMKALKSGIQEAERKRREADPTGPL